MRTVRAEPVMIVRITWAAVVAVALVAAVVVAARRVAWERESRRVEVVVDYDEAAQLSAVTGTPMATFVSECARRGVVSFAVREMTVESLAEEGLISVFRGHELIALSRLTGAVDPTLGRLMTEGRISAGSTYLVVPAGPGSPAGLIAGRLDMRASQAERYSVLLDAGRVEGAPFTVIELMLGGDEAMALTLGIPPEAALLLSARGLGIVPRFLNSGNMTDRRMLRLLETSRPARVDCVVFDGEEVGGYPMAIASVAQAMSGSGVPFGDVEFGRQKGAETLGRLMAPDIGRVHSITAGEMPKTPRREAVDRYARAVRERGIRVAYLRPFPPSSLAGVDPVEYNLDYFGEVVEAVRAQGLEVGPLHHPGPFAPGRAAVAAMACGALAAGVLLLSLLVDLTPAFQAGVFLLAAAGLAGVWLKGYGTLARQMVAFGAAVVFPILAMTVAVKWVARQRRRNASEADSGGREKADPPAQWLRPPRLAATGLALLAGASAVSVTGGMLVAGLLSDHRFFLKVNQFLGVKAMHVLPPLAVIVLYWQFLRVADAGRSLAPDGGGHDLFRVEDSPSLAGALLRLAREPIEAWHLGLLGAVAAVGLIYVLRTGNVAQVPVPALEQQARFTIERLLVIRPRTKEFLLGHPALVAAAVVAAGTGGHLRWSLLPLLVAASVGQLSMVNTFSHMHTPLVVTLLRTAYGLLAGGALGFVVGLLLAIAARSLRWLRGGEGS